MLRATKTVSQKSFYFFVREKPNDVEWLELRDIKLPLLLNFAQCKLNLKEYYAVIEHCNEVLEADPGNFLEVAKVYGKSQFYLLQFSDNVKALFRRGKAHIGAWNPSAAKEDLRRVAELDSSLDTTCK